MTRTRRTFACLAVGLLAGCEERNNGLGPAISRLDRTRPVVVTTLPSQGATQVGLTAPITVTFSEPMRPASITAATITFDPPISGTVTQAGTRAIFTPAFGLAPNTIYRGTVSSAAEDLAGNNLEAPISWTFTTGAPPLLDR